MSCASHKLLLNKLQCTMSCLSHKLLLNKLLSTRTFLKNAQFAISIRPQILWNNYFSKDDKEIDIFLLFK